MWILLRMRKILKNIFATSHLMLRCCLVFHTYSHYAFDGNKLQSIFIQTSRLDDWLFQAHLSFHVTYKVIIVCLVGPTILWRWKIPLFHVCRRSANFKDYKNNTISGKMPEIIKNYNLQLKCSPSALLDRNDKSSYYHLLHMDINVSIYHT